MYTGHYCALFVDRTIRTPAGSDMLAKWSENSTAGKSHGQHRTWNLFHVEIAAVVFIYRLFDPFGIIFF